MKSNYFYKVFQEVLNFAKKPTYEIENKDTAFQKLKFAVSLILLDLILKGVIISLTHFVTNKYINLDLQNVGQDNASKTYSFYWGLLFIGLIIPILEETIFRLSLNLRFEFLALSLTTFITFFTSIRFFNTPLYDIRDHFIEKIAVMSGIFIVLYSILRPFRTPINNLGNNYFHYIFYFFTISFGLIHIKNFNLTNMNLLFAWLITLPQIIGGFTLGFLRIKYGIIWGIFIHCINNLVAYIIKEGFLFIF